MHGITKVAPFLGAGRRAAPPSEKMEADDDREIRFLGDLQRISPKPGDIFALSVDADLSVDQVAHIRESWIQVMGDIPVVVLARGVRLDWLASAAVPVLQTPVEIRIGAHHIGITK